MLSLLWVQWQPESRYETDPDPVKVSCFALDKDTRPTIGGIPEGIQIRFLANTDIRIDYIDYMDPDL